MSDIISKKAPSSWGQENGLISRQAAIDAIVNCTNCGDEKTLRAYVTKHTLDNGWTGGILEAIEAIEYLPSAQPEPISEAYAKAVRTWLVEYQVKCAELQGRYTPYEILGWVVSDWRKENEIW